MNVLQTLYSNFRNWFISLSLLRFLLAIILYRYVIAILFNRPSLFNDYISPEIFIACVTLIYCLLFFGTRKILRPKVRKFKDLSKLTFKKCDEIVDFTDWSNFRKRPIYDNKRLRAQDIVDTVYQIRNYKFFPYKTENSYYTFLYFFNRVMETLISVGLIFVMVYSIYIAF